jgi:hypothetical protein
MTWITSCYKNIINYLNSAKDPEEIARKLINEEDFENISAKEQKKYLSLAKKIFIERNLLPEHRFTSIYQLLKKTGINWDELYEICINLERPKTLYPALLFPVRLETRFIGHELLVRIYPDDILIESHEEALSIDELTSLKEYNVIVEQAISERARATTEEELTKAIEKKKSAWRELARRFGSKRAAWIVKKNTEPNPKQSSWTKAPAVKVLPDRFIVYLYKQNSSNNQEKLAYQVQGNIIPPVLPVMMNPTSTSNEEDTLFDTAAKWVTDFNAALKVGMAIKVKLKCWDDGKFSRIIVVGLNRHLDKDDGNSLLANLINSHHYTTGFSFIPHGTPTNNTTNTRSGYTTAENDYDRCYETEVNGTGATGNDRSAAVQLSKAIGVASSLFEHCDYAAEIVNSYSAEMQEALWPALGDYFLTYMLSNPLGHEHRYALWHHFRSFVRSRGPLPTICVGKQPYGILPVTNFSKWKSSAADNFQQTETSIVDLQEFDTKFHAVLMVLYKRWLYLSQQETIVPRVGQSNNQDDEILKILAMEPSSISYHQRPIVDASLVGWLLYNLRNHFFGAGTIFQELSGGPNAWIVEWAKEWLHSKNGAEILLKELAQATGVSDDILLHAIIMNVFSWGRGEELENTELPLVCDPDTPDKGLSYLSSFEYGVPSSGTSNTLLFNLLRRSLVYQYQPDEYRLKSMQPVEQTTIVYEYVNNGKVIIITAHQGDIVRKDTILLFVESTIRQDNREYTVRYSIHAPSDGKVLQLYVDLETMIDLNDPLVLFEIYPTAENRIKNAISELHKSGIGCTALEGIFRDTMDLHTHRLDAWLTSFATKRLYAMRERKLQSQGIYLGAYGWLENLERKKKSASAGEGGFIHAPSIPQAAAGAVLRNAYITHKDDETGNSFRIDLTSDRVRRALRLLEGVREGQELNALLGYQFERGLHDREQDVFIDAFRTVYPLVAHKETPQQNGESAESVAARNVVDGLALARAWSLIKNDVERNIFKQAVITVLNIPGITGLSDHVTKELYLLCDSLDSVSDLLLYESMFHAVQGNYERSGAALEASAGVARPPEIESVKTPISGVSLGHRVCILFNGTFEYDGSERGNVGPRGNAEPRLNNWFGGLLGPMNNIGCTARILQININSASMEELMSLPKMDAEKAQSIIATREQDGIYIVISDLRRAGIEADLIAEWDDSMNVESFAPIPVTLANLNVSPLDFLYMSSKQPRNEETELEQRIKYFLRASKSLGPKTKIKIDFSRSPENFTRSMTEAIEFTHHILNLVSSSKHLKSETLLRPEEGTKNASFTAEDYWELMSRVRVTRALLMDYLSNSQLTEATVTSEKTVFFEISKYGIEGSIPPSPKDPDVEDRKKTVLSTIKKRVGDCTRLLSESNTLAYPDDGTDPDFGKAIDRLVEAMKALFGNDFVVLPICSGPNPTDLQNAIDQNNILGTNDVQRFYLWLQQVAQIHPAVRRLEDVLLVSDAWITSAVTATTDYSSTLNEIPTQSLLLPWIAQLPIDPKRRWLALSDEEQRGGLTTEEIELLQNDVNENGRPRGVLSIVCLAPGRIDFNKKVCGLVIDQWDELIPQTTQRTGITFQYDRPNSQAPQSLLLAVPGELDPKKPDWSLQQIRDIVKDTMDLAKIRLVDLDAFKTIGRFSPALFLPSDETKPLCTKKIDIGNFDDVMTRIVGDGNWQDIFKFWE